MSEAYYVLRSRNFISQVSAKKTQSEKQRNKCFLNSDIRQQTLIQSDTLFTLNFSWITLRGTVTGLESR